MKLKNILLLIFLASLAFVKSGHGADILWNHFSLFTIPDDENTYYIISAISPIQDFLVLGNFEIRSGGELRDAGFLEKTMEVDGGTITVKNGGAIKITRFGSDSREITITDGLVELESGAIYYNSFAGGSATGAINLNGGTLKINNGATLLQGRGSGISTGSLIINGGILDLQGTIQSGPLSVNSNSVVTLNSGKLILGKNASIKKDVAKITTSIFGAPATVSDGAMTVAPGQTLTVPSGSTLEVDRGATVNANGIILNQATSTLDIYGNVYTYSTVQNGDGSNPGTININVPGSLFVLGGILKNGNASSVIDVNNGGNLYNYYGEIDANLGQLNLNSGGKLHNARGTLEYSSFNIFSGSNFLDSDEISLDRDLDIDFTWTVTGKSVINGNGNKIRFGAEGAILVAGAGSSLLLKDIFLNDVSSNGVRCTHDTTTFSIDNVVWAQDSNFSFTKGYFEVLGDWTILGKNTIFNYTTDQVSTLSFDSELRLVDCTFNYDTGAATRLAFQDSTAHLHLDRAKFLATQACTLADGTLVTSGLGTLEGTGALDVSGLDNIEIAGDLQRVGSVTL